MIKAADRLNTVKEYYFSAKLKELKERSLRGEEIINLGIGSPDMVPSKITIDALSHEIHKPDAHSYQPYNGVPALRKAISRWYNKTYGIIINEESEVLPLIGSKEGVMHISLAFLNPGDEVLIPNPGYPAYQSVSKIVGAKIREYNLNEDNWEPDFAQLESMDLSKVKMMWVNYPNMPTGTPGSFELFSKLVEFGKKHQILICNDNPYSLILHKKPLSIFQVKGAKEIAIELNSLSKSHNMAGWRIGMVIANPTFLKYIIGIKSNMDSGMFKPMQLAAAKALTNKNEWHQKRNTEYLQRKKIVLEILNLLNCELNENQGGMFVWAKIPGKKDAETFIDEILEKTGVFITPGSIFGSVGKRYVRVSLCANQSTLKKVKSKIEKLVKENGTFRDQKIRNSKKGEEKTLDYCRAL